ncbi:MBL fold metallo-hydrolase [Natranaerofaba carboxydovora]|uniref:MBL fold metallo-hydrolase n=1 Tax=Natranaerofaba carboxydovora TaxID=2742683 RepID=UPI001F14466F|nr:MBL fold metallo-hydrolase [Natranaerofaba carboxydovora]UMZ72677.1 putative quorum-quenching lactonase YtnP [Natranaerofaba carboxydovora]
MEELSVGNIKLNWLKNGVTNLDGGAMFGVVPKKLWSNKYPNDEENRIPQRCDPILVQSNQKNILIEGGIGKGKFNEKQKKIFGLIEDGDIEESLKELGLSLKDIDIVACTHMHYDHFTGISRYSGKELIPTFPNAEIFTSSLEWQETKEPTDRSKNSYWEENWKPVMHQVKTFENELELTPEVKIIHTGGHCQGHCILTFESEGEKAVHLGDLLPTHAHLNPLWVMAYDDYPMRSIEVKKEWISKVKKEDWWVVLYHDNLYRALKLNEEGEITEKINTNL